MATDTLPPPFENVSLLRSTFRPRANGPQVIGLCGNPQMYHSNLRCPAMLPEPECDCHDSREQAQRKVDRGELDPAVYGRALAQSNKRARRDDQYRPRGTR